MQSYKGLLMCEILTTFRNFRPILLFCYIFSGPTHCPSTIGVGRFAVLSMFIVISEDRSEILLGQTSNPFACCKSCLLLKY
jgi:hypothetical protein